MNDIANLPLSGKVALVTGASSGLGKGIALRLGRDGADVAVNYHSNRPGADETVAELRAMGRRAEAVNADVSDPQAVELMIQKVESSLGPCDVLVANAGFVQLSTIFDLEPDQWDRMFAVVLKGTFLCAKAVLPGMRKRGAGRIVTISSDAAKRGAMTNGPHYGAAKAGVIGLMRGLALQVAGEGITVNDVCPADIPVERWAGRSAERIASTLLGVPRGRFGTPDEIGAAVAFLASEDAAHITGISLDVSGGAMLT